MMRIEHMKTQLDTKTNNKDNTKHKVNETFPSHMRTLISTIFSALLKNMAAAKTDTFNLT